MSDWDFLNEFTGSMFNDRETLQMKLNDSNLSQYEKEQLVKNHNWHYLDTMTTDPVENIFRHNLQPLYVETAPSRPSPKEYTSSYTPAPAYNPSTYCTPVERKPPYDVFTALKKVAEAITVRNTDKKPAGNRVTDAWIINRLNYMFCCLMKNEPDGQACVARTEKLVGTAAGLGDAFAVLKEACAKEEVYFCLPGAMLLVLEKYKGSEATESYKNLSKLYGAYMDALVFDISYYRLVYSNLNLYAKKGREYFSVIYKNEWSGVSVCCDPIDLVEAYKIHQQFISSMYPAKKSELVEPKPETAYELIRCWCDPLSFYGSGKPECGYRTGPDSVGDRYAFFAGKLLDAKAQYGLIVSCLENGCKADADFYNRNTELVKRYIFMCNQSDACVRAWARLKEIFCGNIAVEKMYISFCGERMRENLAQFSNNSVNYKRQGVFDNRRSSELEKVADVIDEAFRLAEAEVKPFADAGLDEELKNQKRLTYEKLDEIRRSTDRLVTEYNAKKYWMPNNKCRHCGGDFRGIFKKVCSVCGKEKDY